MIWNWLFDDNQRKEIVGSKLLCDRAYLESYEQNKSFHYMIILWYSKVKHFVLFKAFIKLPAVWKVHFLVYNFLIVDLHARYLLDNLIINHMNQDKCDHSEYILYKVKAIWIMPRLWLASWQVNPMLSIFSPKRRLR